MNAVHSVTHPLPIFLVFTKISLNALSLAYYEGVLQTLNGTELK